MRCEQTTAGRRHLCRHDRQQPDGGHLINAVFLTGKHHVRDQHAASQRHGHIDPPQHFGEVNHAVTPARQAKHQKAVDDGRQAHGNRAEEHRNRGVAENPPGLVEEQHPARGVCDGKQAE
ncbi:hypothetical protein D3C81_1755910 [compost metagenome]